MRHSVIGYKQIDINRILENLVFSHLQIMGYQVFVGKLGNKEIDFVGKKQGKKIYIQAAHHITKENKEREFGNLLAIKDNYPKFVVSMDDLIDLKGHKGIRHLHLRDFLSLREL